MQVRTNPHLTTSFPLARQAAKPREVYGLLEEPPELRGLLFLQHPEGEVEILRRSGETDPDSAPDIPDAAVTDKGVFISVDGIGQDWPGHRQQIKDWFQGGTDHAVELPGPVVGIHEGEGKSTLHDGIRILKNTWNLKRLQRGRASVESVRKAAYANDPSIQTIHDQLAQSLRVGRQVTFMAHSGGASQVALALALLVREDEAWKPRVEEQVRVLGTAPAAHRKDYEWTGVKPENIMITGSKRDPVYRFFSNHLDPEKPLSFARFLCDGTKAAIGFALNPGPFHQGEYILPGNIENGRHLIGEFLEGGPGRDRVIP